MADIKKFLDQNGVSVLWSKIAQKVAADVKVEADRALLAEKAITDKIGTVTEGKTVVEMIADAQSAATYDDTALAGRVSTLEGEDAGKSVRAIANEELAKQLIADDAQESLDTLAEIAAWIQEHPEDAAAMNEAITALQNKVDTGDKTVSAYVTDAIASKANQADLEAEAALARAAEKANADAIAAIKDDANIDSFADVVAALSGKQDTIPANTYDAYGSAAQALTDAKAYTDTEIGKIQALTAEDIEAAIAAATNA